MQGALRLADGAALIDTGHAGRAATIGSFLVPHAGEAGRSGRFDLVEVGAEIDMPAVERAIVALGFECSGVDRVLVTHIHLDHAGAAGAWATRHGARVVVLRAGAEHLLDPSRLLSSARRVYGNAMERTWGGMTPVPADSLQAVDDGDAIEVGARRVRVIATPGHARHHAAFLWPDGALYTGDSAGVRFAPWAVVRPAVPPPEVDLAAWDATFERLHAVGASELRLTHFGAFADVERHLDAARERTHAWADAVLAWARAGATRADARRSCDEMARAELEAAGADGATVRRYLATSDAAMSVAGLERYWRTQHPERWPGWEDDDA